MNTVQNTTQVYAQKEDTVLADKQSQIDAAWDQYELEQKREFKKNFFKAEAQRNGTFQPKQ